MAGNRTPAAVWAKFRRGRAPRRGKGWPTGIRGLRRTDWSAWEERERPEVGRRREDLRAAAGGTGWGAPARARHKGGGEQLQGVLRMLFIGKGGKGRGARPGNDGGVEEQCTGGSSRR
jgi:hypothetical protein